MIISLDIETARADHVKNTKDHDALVPHKNKITCVGAWQEDGEHQVFRGPDMIERLDEYLRSIRNLELLGQGFKFDIKNLVLNAGMDAEFLIDSWQHDTQMMAYVHPIKIPKSWLEKYERARVEENKKLPQGVSHRKAKEHSLKTLAPYHLGVEPFWEDPANHDSDEYVLKDVRYTYELYLKLKELMHPDDYKFYKEKHLVWAKELLRAELKGVKINTVRARELQREAEKNRDTALIELVQQWAEPLESWKHKIISEDSKRIDEMQGAAIERLKDKSRIPAVIERHDKKRITSLEKLDTSFNFSSPQQLTWLLKDQLKYNITNLEGKESTEHEVLESLAKSHKDIANLIEYRKWNKLCTTYYPSYEEFNNRGRIHCSFNTNTTRTGRLSSSHPNLQNQPKEPRAVFMPDPGYVFITKDLGQIEPRLAAYFSEDPTLCKLIIEGKDFHGETARAIFPYIKCDNSEIKAKYSRERAVAKTAGLAILYGSGANRLLGILFKEGFTEYTKAGCRRIVERIRQLYRGVWEFKKDLDKRLSRGEIVYNLFGRPIGFQNKDEVYMKGFNRLIQGSASDLLLSSIHVYNEKCRHDRIDSQIAITVHDENLAQAPEVLAEDCEKLLVNAMTDYELPTKYGNIPLIAEGEIGDAWIK